ncbi:hypothetical protein E3N88_03159 [Mikania micrantha]|uniref:Uncharacterized protein n=1 Tax=Mikania micrantha TaxID=192012 RepID=A0A5N6Q683_9ASTR|nr:hypothetical protein E3N88_03159 [Mikania micrantha]
MHQWPSKRYRDSFNAEYLNTVEWNLQRMNNAKNKTNRSAGSISDEKLLGDDTCNQNHKHKNRFRRFMLAVLNDLVMIFSCCYCCEACIG